MKKTGSKVLLTTEELLASLKLAGWDETSDDKIRESAHLWLHNSKGFSYSKSHIFVEHILAHKSLALTGC